ncbi:Bug family tripartite tricarboxylate transporter substrate binding protein [Azohydromonas lata]|uniref:Bug family tripartite tricarboxylate transporter substrate binding protein n=1 Tax=Azohydromonas lata TaxID=45677 RepID=UPI000B29E9B2|nr:tripartite tricarboxylate transporter substrate binding protein [Azohydromonas lata]
MSPRSVRTRLSGISFSLALGLGVLGAAASAQADGFPERAVTLVVPTPAGGPLDFFARLLSPALGKRWSVPVIVENKPGAGTALGTQAVARAKPDGYQLLIANIAISAHGALNRTPLFDVERELQPLTLIASTPYFLIASQKGPTTLDAFVAQAKSKSGELNLGIIANSQQHLDTVRMMTTLGIKATLVPYTGTAPIIRALLGGELHGYLGTLAGMEQHFAAKKLFPLAMTGSKPWPSQPSVPTFQSKGYSLELNPWYAAFAPAGLPPQVTGKLREDLLAVMKTAEFQSRVRDGGYEPRTSTDTELARMVSDNLRLSREIVQANNIKPE